MEGVTGIDQELSPGDAPKPLGQPASGPQLPAWLKRRVVALRPRTRRRWALYASLVLLALFLLFVWSTATTYQAQVLVIDQGGGIGLSPAYTDRLDFGDLPQGAEGTLTIILENESRIPLGVVVVARGDIRQFLGISDAFFVLRSGQTKDVKVSAGIPGTAAQKHYSGKVYVFRVPWLPWP